jgi:hypothetical protein
VEDCFLWYARDTRVQTGWLSAIPNGGLMAIYLQPRTGLSKDEVGTLYCELQHRRSMTTSVDLSYDVRVT